MAQYKVKTRAVIDGKPVGSVIELSKNDFEWLNGIGYVDLIEEVKSADTPKKATTRKPRTTRKKSTEE